MSGVSNGGTQSFRVCTPSRDIVRTNAWKIIVHEKGLILFWDLPSGEVPYVEWVEA